MACRRCSCGCRAAPGRAGRGPGPASAGIAARPSAQAFQQAPACAGSRPNPPPPGPARALQRRCQPPAKSHGARTMAMKAQRKERGTKSTCRNNRQKPAFTMSDASHPASPSASTPPPVTPRPSWLQTLRVYLEPASLRMLALGFSAGLPLLLVLGTLSFRLREAGIDRSTIGYLSWVGPGLWLQVGLGPAGRPVADSGAHALAGAAAQLAAAVAVLMVAQAGGHGRERPARRAGPPWCGARWRWPLARPRKTLPWMPIRIESASTQITRRRWPPPTRRVTGWP